jgi:ABC-type Fe3+-siderophore transport system permease subunit
MKKGDIVYIVGSVFAAVTAISYSITMCRWFPVNLPRYYPTEHVWRLGATDGMISQGWYGMQGFAFLAGGIAAAIAYVILKKSARHDLKPLAIRFTGVVTIAAILLSMAFMLYHEFDKWGIL